MNARAGIAVPQGPPANAPAVEPDRPGTAAWDASVPFPDLLKSGTPEASEDADPVVAPAREATPPRKNAAFAPARIGTFLFSAFLHVGLLSLAAGALVAAGREPPEEAVSVEIVLEAPARPTPPARPVQASAAAAAESPSPSPKAEAVSPPPEEHETPPPTAEDKAFKSDAAPSTDRKDARQAPVSDTRADQPVPAEDTQAVAVPQPDSSTLSILSVPPFVPAPAEPAAPAAAQDAGKKIESAPRPEPEETRKPKPQPQAPAEPRHPTPRPTAHDTARENVTHEHVTHREPEKKAQARKEEKLRTRREKAQPEKAQDRKTGREHNGAVRSRAAAASPGEKAAYARKLLAHVQRYKRYPLAAQRAGITGDARLSITIDRSGTLRGARLVSSAGSALLDKEAMEVARRASPYPPPPPGMGGATFSFVVTLRFTR
jgi:protein TonB